MTDTGEMTATGAIGSAVAELLGGTPAPAGAAHWAVSVSPGPSGRSVIEFGRFPDREPARSDFVHAVAALRLTSSLNLRDWSFDYLSGRRSGDGPLVLQQLVRVQLAQVATAHLELASLLTAPPKEPAADRFWLRWHRQLTDVDRALLRLLGASGYLQDGPGAHTHQSEMLGEIYAAPGGR